MKKICGKFLGASIAVCLMLTMTAIAGNIADDLKIAEAGKKQIIKLDDGSTLVGRITDVGDNEIKFETDMGEMTIAIERIKEVSEVRANAFKGGKYWFPNPNRTRLYFSPTGRSLEQGQGFFSDWYLFFPSVTYGFTSNVSLGVGISIFPGVSLDKQLLYFTPKIGIRAVKGLDLAVSAMIIRIPDWDEEDVFGDDSRSFYVGTIYGVGTVGSDDHSFTFGLGWGYADDEISDRPFVIIGGETRAFRRLSFVAEGWLMPGVDQPLIIYGTRFFGEGLAIDLGFLTPLGEDALIPGIPFLGFVYNF